MASPKAVSTKLAFLFSSTFCFAQYCSKRSKNVCISPGDLNVGNFTPKVNCVAMFGNILDAGTPQHPFDVDTADDTTSPNPCIELIGASAADTVLVTVVLFTGGYVDDLTAVVPA